MAALKVFKHPRILFVNVDSDQQWREEQEGPRCSQKASEKRTWDRAPQQPNQQPQL